MVLLTCQIQIYLPESGSLKSKRQIVKSLKERIRNRFNVSVAEIDQSQLWQRSTLGVATVSTAFKHANEVLSKAVKFVERDGRVELLDYSIEPH